MISPRYCAMSAELRLDHEGDVVGQEIGFTAQFATGTSAFQTPGHNDEVCCAMDAKGEAGSLLGSRYNSKDAPPDSSNDVVTVTLAGGFIQLDTASGHVTLKSPGSVTIEAAGDVKINAANIVLESGTLTHNGKNVGHDQWCWRWMICTSRLPISL